MDFQRARAVGKVAAAVEEAGQHRRNQLEGGFRLEHHHVELAVSRLVVVRYRDVELDLREIHEQDAKPVALQALAIEVEDEMRFLRHGVRDGRR